MKKEIILFLIGFMIIISVSQVLASNIFEETFSRFNTGVIGFILSLVPLIILVIITIIALKKANTILLTIQFLLWWIFTIYVCIRAYAFIDAYLSLGLMPKAAIDFFTINNVPTEENEYYWYVLSIFVNAGIGLLMSIGNNTIRKILYKISR